MTNFNKLKYERAKTRSNFIQRWTAHLRQKMQREIIHPTPENVFYRPQRYFYTCLWFCSQGVSVQKGLCPRGLCPGGLCPGGLCPGGSLSNGSMSRGSLFRRDLCPGGSVQGVCSEEISVQGGLSRGVSVQGVCSEGISVQGGSVKGGLCSGGLCSEGISVQGVSVQGDLCLGVSSETLPPVNRITDTCKHYLAATLLRAVKIYPQGECLMLRLRSREATQEELLWAAVRSSVTSIFTFPIYYLYWRTTCGYIS